MVNALAFSSERVITRNALSLGKYLIWIEASSREGERRQVEVPDADLGLEAEHRCSVLKDVAKAKKRNILAACQAVFLPYPTYMPLCGITNE